MKPRTIEQIEVFPATAPITRTFNFASGSAGSIGSRAKLLFVKVTDSEGCYGWGEARAHPQWSYESPESLVSTIRTYLAPAIIGQSIWERRSLHERMHASVGRGPSTGMPLAKAAVDIALHDLCARAVGLPLRAFLGGDPTPTSMDLGWTIAVKDSAEAEEDMDRALKDGFRHFNFKIGGTLDHDRELTRTVRAKKPKESLLWTDANQGLRFPEAVKRVHMLEEEGVDVMEQPLAADQLHQMERLRAQTSLCFGIDESCVGPGDFFTYAKLGLIDYYVIKLTRSGGIWPTLLQLGVAQSAGLGLLLSGLSDSMVTKLAACQTAAAFGYEGPAALNGSQFMDDSELFPTKSKIENGGSLLLDDSPGIGIEPDESALRHNAWEL